MNDLIKKYPHFFEWVKEYREENPEGPIEPMEFGIECGKGWYWLLDNLMSEITTYLKDNEHRDIPLVRVTQIKEKFGGLRFYYDGGDDYVHGMVWLAEGLSYKICETCGSTEEVSQTGGWIKTICKKCLESN